MPTKPFTIFLICALPLLLVPQWPLLFLAPYLVVTIYRCTRIQALWRAFAAGLFFDLLSSSTVFGTTPLIYCLVTAVLSTQKYNFFEDKISTLPLMTTFYSFLTTLLTMLISSSLHLSPLTLATDLVALPLLDGLYALVAVSLPFTITRKLRRLRLNAYFRKSDRG